MNRDQIELLERAEVARVTAEAHGYEATAEALAQISAMLVQNLDCSATRHSSTEAFAKPRIQVRQRQLLQVVS